MVIIILIVEEIFKLCKICNELDFLGVCCGKKNNVSISSIIVIILIVNWVSVKFGVENWVKVIDIIRFIIEIIIKDIICEWC